MLAVLGVVLLLAACAPAPRRGEQGPPALPTPSPVPTPVPAPSPLPSPAPTPLPDRLELRDASWNELPGWGKDSLAEAVPALLRSCDVWRARGAQATIGEDAVGGHVADWLPFCDRVHALAQGDEAALRALFEETLRPVAVTNRGDDEGLFTGYYEPTLRGSRTEGGAYRIPLYVRPPELVSVDLGLFRPDLKGKRIAGKVKDGALVPYYDRARIEQGALAGRNLELVWVDDAVEAFFLQIQGSGRIELAEGGEMRVGYAGQNGYPYVAIGKELVRRGAIAQEQVSLQSIRDWLESHGEEGVEVMRTNPSYVFFREITGEGPLGSLGVPLTPLRSLAVDPLFVPLGAPLWLDTTVPATSRGPASAWQHVMVAQDTGGAIRGPVRGDVFWGHEEGAAELAGSMKQRGRLWLLLPKSVPLPPPQEDETASAPAPTPPPPR